MRKIKLHFFCISFLLVIQSINGQDAIFSDLLSNKILLNPALAPTLNGPIAFQLNYREQGASISDGLPIRTFLADANLNFKSLGTDKMSVGFSFMNDIGGLGHINSKIGQINFAYLKKISGKYSKIGEHFLSFGTQLGAGQRTVSWDRFWFGNQFNREYGYVDKTISSGEESVESNETGISSVFADINSGLLWYANYSSKFSARAGISLYHLNTPNISFLKNKEDNLKMRTNFHAGFNLEISKEVNINPIIIFMTQGKSNQMIFGSKIGISNQDFSEAAMNIGLFSRMVSNNENFGMEAIIITLNIDYNNLKFGLGYDITTSSLSKYNNSRGAWEFFFASFLVPEQKNKTKSKEKIFKF